MTFLFQIDEGVFKYGAMILRKPSDITTKAL